MRIRLAQIPIESHADIADKNFSQISDGNNVPAFGDQTVFQTMVNMGFLEFKIGIEIFSKFLLKFIFIQLKQAHEAAYHPLADRVIVA